MTGLDVVVLCLLAATAWLAVLLTQRRRRSQRVLQRLSSGGPEAEVAEAIPQALPRQKSGAARGLRRAGLQISMAGVLAWGLPFLAILALIVSLGSGWPAALGATAAAVLLAALGLKLLGDVRMNRVEARLPEALDLVIGGLASGLDLLEAFTFAAAELDGPIASELDAVLRQTGAGLAFPDALDRLAQLLGGDGCQLLAKVVRVKWEIGGELAQPLRRVATILRDRRRLKRRLQTATAASKTSVLAIMMISYAVVVVMWLLYPGIQETLWTKPGGRLILIVAGLFQATGLVWIWWLLRRVQV